MMIVIAVDQTSITQTCGPTLLGRIRPFAPDPRFRNAPLSGGCTNMSPTVSVRLFFSFANQNNRLLSARVARATSQTTSGATTAETAGTSVT
jgi:hypothetical protein